MSLILPAAAAVPSPAYIAAAEAVTISLAGAGGLTLATPIQTTHWPQIWDLTQGDLTLSYTIDMNGMRQPGTWDTYNGAAMYAQVGLHEEGAGDLNPGWTWDAFQGSAGGYMVSGGDYWTDGDGVAESGRAPALAWDQDDKHYLSTAQNRDERSYDCLLANPDAVLNPPIGDRANYGVWFDRDGVGPWEDNSSVTPAGPGSSVPWGESEGRKTYDTGGIYRIVIKYHAIDANRNGDKADDGLGAMFATVNGVPTGFYATVHEGEPDYHPAGLSFRGDMKHMQVFAGVWGPNSEDWAVSWYGLEYFDFGWVRLSDISVTGFKGASDPLAADFTCETGVGFSGLPLQFVNATRGGMPPYTYSWTFGDTLGSTLPAPSHVYSEPDYYRVSLTVTPYRGVPATVVKTITVYALRPGGAAEPGYWTDEAAQEYIGGEVLSALGTLNLKDIRGGDFDPASFRELKNWLLASKASYSMAYKLSAQLAMTELNVRIMGVKKDALIYAPGSLAGAPVGIVALGQVMAEANAEIGVNSLTLPGHTSRSYQEALKNALEQANNNLNFVIPPGGYSPY